MDHECTFQKYHAAHTLTLCCGLYIAQHNTEAHAHGGPRALSSNLDRYVHREFADALPEAIHLWSFIHALLPVLPFEDEQGLSKDLWRAHNRSI